MACCPTDCPNGSAVLEIKAGPSVRDRQLLVRTSNFLHISLQIDVWISQKSDQDRQLFQLSLEHYGSVQDCSNSSALAMGLLQSCTKPLID